MAFRSRRRSQPKAYVLSEAGPQGGASAPGAAIRVSARCARAKQADRTHMRILMCAVVFVFVFAALGVRLAYVSFGDIAPSRILTAAAPVDTPRPELIDRNGALLATHLPMMTLEVAGREIWDADETAAALAGILDNIDEKSLAKKLREGRYVEVRTDLTPAERRAVFALGLPGIHFSTHNKRFYPQADLAAHVVGHSEPGKGGVMGLEKVLNDWSAQDWSAQKAVRASIDVRAQQALEAELSAAMKKFHAKAAWGGVMDADTGEVIALASLPDFDPNAPGAAPADQRRNRATYDRYELGSALKAITAASVLEAGLAKEGTIYDARGTLKVADRRISDFKGKNRFLTLSEVIQHSSNIGAARMAADLGPARQKKFLKSVGLFEALDIELAENRPPELPGQWGPVEAATISYGHGISITPLHLMAAFTAVINGGVYRTPVFLADREMRPGKRVFSERTSATMRRILRRVIIDGTATHAEVSGYYPIGKTATADKPSGGGYKKDARITSFIGAVPGYAPRYVVLMSLDDPQAIKGTYGYATAGWNVAPAFANLVNRLAPILGLSPVNEAVALAAFVSGDGVSYRKAQIQSREHGVAR